MLYASRRCRGSMMRKELPKTADFSQRIRIQKFFGRPSFRKPPTKVGGSYRKDGISLLQNFGKSEFMDCRGVKAK